MLPSACSKISGQSAQDAWPDQPRNFLTHATSLSLTRIGDGLIDPKLVLAWLVQALGAPS